MTFTTLIDYPFLGNSLSAWGQALLVLLGSAVGVWLLLRIMVARLAQLVVKTDNELDDAAVELLRRVRWWVLLALGVYVAARSLQLPDAAVHWVRGIAIVAAFVQLGIWLNGIVALSVERARKRRESRAPAAATGLAAAGIVARLVIWSLLLLLMLSNLGVNVTTLVASLGVGGVAVALAVQNVLGDLFASFSIIFDKPFVVGDFLVIDGHLGSVEYVGLKTTRLRSLTGEQLVFANSDLLRSRIRNFGRMQERRISFDIGVTYQTPREQLQQIPTLLREVIEAQPQTRFDRAHFKSFGDFSLIFEIVYYVATADYNTYMDIQQAINLGIHEGFETRGIEFAYPTRTVVLQGNGPAGEAGVS